MKKLTKLKNKFLAWLYQYIEKEARNQHGVDLKCPGCQEWFSVSSIKHTHTYNGDTSYGCVVTCGQCGTESHWNLEAAPFPLRCDENGSIL